MVRRDNRPTNPGPRSPVGKLSKKLRARSTKHTCRHCSHHQPVLTSDTTLASTRTPSSGRQGLEVGPREHGCPMFTRTLSDPGPAAPGSSLSCASPFCHVYSRRELLFWPQRDQSPRRAGSQMPGTACGCLCCRLRRVRHPRKRSLPPAPPRRSFDAHNRQWRSREGQ